LPDTSLVCKAYGVQYYRLSQGWGRTQIARSFFNGFDAADTRGFVGNERDRGDYQRNRVSIQPIP